MDLPKQIDMDDGIALDCFVHERKLQVCKSAASHVHQPSRFQATVLKHVVWADLEALSEETMMTQESYLLEPLAFSKEISDAIGEHTYAAKVAMLRHGKVTADDVVVLRDGSVAQVKANIRIYSGWFLMKNFHLKTT